MQEVIKAKDYLELQLIITITFSINVEDFCERLVVKRMSS